jgi:ABC-type phosphate transport system substrate-binding protein
MLAPGHLTLLTGRIVAILVLLAGASRGTVAQRPAEVVVIVHPANPIRTLSAQQLEAIFTLSQRQWPDGKPIVAVHPPFGDPLRGLFDKVVLRLDADQVGRFWIDLRVRHGTLPPRSIGNPALAARLVSQLPGAITYVPARLATGAVRVVARIQRGEVATP